MECHTSDSVHAAAPGTERRIALERPLLDVKHSSGRARHSVECNEVVFPWITPTLLPPPPSSNHQRPNLAFFSSFLSSLHLFFHLELCRPPCAPRMTPPTPHPPSKPRCLRFRRPHVGGFRHHLAWLRSRDAGDEGGPVVEDLQAGSSWEGHVGHPKLGQADWQPDENTLRCLTWGPCKQIFTLHWRVW